MDTVGVDTTLGILEGVVGWGMHKEGIPKRVGTMNEGKLRITLGNIHREVEQGRIALVHRVVRHKVKRIVDQIHSLREVVGEMIIWRVFKGGLG